VRKRGEMGANWGKIIYQSFFRRASDIYEILKKVEQQFGSVKHCAVKGL